MRSDPRERQHGFPAALHESALALLEDAVAWQAAPGERAMLLRLLQWLARTGSLRSATQTALELPWRGRRVDLATVTLRGVTSAYELKMASNNRALEQAIYNRSAFHRSYVVTSSQPSSASIAVASDHGVGLIVVNGTVSKILPSPLVAPDAAVNRRLLNAFGRKRV